MTATLESFDRFSVRARKVILLATEEAKLLGHRVVGTEHLLLGLLREGDGLAGLALHSVGLEAQAVRKEVLETVGSNAAPFDGTLELAPRARRSIELGVHEAQELNHPFIGTEHLLLGILDEGEGVACGIIEKLGLQLSAVRDAVLKLLSEKSRGNGVKRYNLALPEELFNQVQALADRENTTVVELLRRFVKLGLLASRLADASDSALILREHGVERQVLLL